MLAGLCPSKSKPHTLQDNKPLHGMEKGLYGKTSHWGWGKGVSH